MASQSPTISSTINSAAFYIALIAGPLEVLCILVVFLLRRHSVYAIRVPKVTLGSMFMKVIAFGLMAWVLMDEGCPCAITGPLVFWVEWTGNTLNAVRRVILLFRYEIQAALASSAAVTVDYNNFFVRYRTMLKSRTQSIVMVLISVYVGIPLLIMAASLPDLAGKPCITARIDENPLVLSTILWVWIGCFVPMMGVNYWTTRRLSKFPTDHWHMVVEAKYASVGGILAGIAATLTLVFVPTFDGIVFMFYTWSLPLLIVYFFVFPVIFLRKTVQTLATRDISTLSSLDRLLHVPAFLERFDEFLRTEFSGENLFFWKEVNKLQEKYPGLLADVSHHEHAQDVNHALLVEAAEGCRTLGRQCIGEKAPWQINISGFTGQDMEEAIGKVNALLKQEPSAVVEKDLRQAVEDAIRALIVAQQEVYELLRKDPYPRFLLSSAAQEFNRDNNFKRLLASERLEGEIEKTRASPDSDSKSSSDPASTHSSNRHRLSEMSPGTDHSRRALQSQSLTVPVYTGRSRKSQGDIPARESQGESPASVDHFSGQVGDSPV